MSKQVTAEMIDKGLRIIIEVVPILERARVLFLYGLYDKAREAYREAEAKREEILRDIEEADK